MSLGKRIKKIRLEKGMTTKDFGKIVGDASDSNVSSWEKGRTSPNAERLKAIADLGEISVEELLQDDEMDKLKYELEQSKESERELYRAYCDMCNEIATLKQEVEQLKRQLRYGGIKLCQEK